MFKEKQCEFCDATFVPKKRSDQKYCSYDCGKKMWTKNKVNEAREKTMDFICRKCDIKFKPKRFYKTCRQEFCSKRCKSDFHKDKKLSQLKEDANLTIRECLYCKKTFVPNFNSNHIRQSYCSNSCNKEFHKEQSRLQTQEDRANTIKLCPICDKEFSPKKTMKQIYCTRKCANSIQRRVYRMMKHCYESTKTSKSDHAHEVLGYSPSDLLKHLETFPQWKTLKNQKWHLDHKFPIIAFVRKGITDISLICRLDNLQPLAGTENCKKNDKYEEDLFEEWLNSEN